MILIPVRVDTPRYRWPIANVAILAILVAGCVWQISRYVVRDEQALVPYSLNGWYGPGMVTHMFLHPPVMHFIGTLLFLWVFGNAVCEKVGNLIYPLVFIALGAAAASVHNMAGGGEAIGASGAINGIVGMALIWFPLETISLYYSVGVSSANRSKGGFEITVWWVVLLWILMAVFDAAFGSTCLVGWAHVGGFVGGMALACLLTVARIGTTYDNERTLLHLLGLRR